MLFVSKITLNKLRTIWWLLGPSTKNLYKLSLEKTFLLFKFYYFQLLIHNIVKLVHLNIIKFTEI